MSGSHSFTSLMVEKKAEQLECLHGVLENKKIVSREQFTDLMQAAFQVASLDPNGLANDLGYSSSTVYRWIEGVSAPHKSLWDKVVSWILSTIETRLEEYNRSAVSEPLEA
jgi:hypothetical protein